MKYRKEVGGGVPAVTVNRYTWSVELDQPLRLIEKE
jgi:hypothetical protein